LLIASIERLKLQEYIDQLGHETENPDVEAEVRSRHTLAVIFAVSLSTLWVIRTQREQIMILLLLTSPVISQTLMIFKRKRRILCL
jgi:hypothetical protein